MKKVFQLTLVFLMTNFVAVYASFPVNETHQYPSTINLSQSKKDLLNSDCDLIILKNGQEIQAKVIEVGTSEIKYKNCDNQNGPTFSKQKSEVFMIKYPNGTSTVIEDQRGDSKAKSNSGGNSNDRSLVVAVLLWFFFGLIGVHRFYLGDIGMGVLYLLTGGLCGIGWLVDGILFLTGSLKPKNGEYID
jgi:TM2 domain-containing membrane protein YozV